MSKAPYQIRFEADDCIGSGCCAVAAPDLWAMDASSGLARCRLPRFGPDALPGHLAAAAACPARKGDGVIRIIDRRTGEVLA